MAKVSVQILPTFKDLKTALWGKGKKDISVFSVFEETMYLDCSATALELICRTAAAKKEGPLHIWVPQHFCGEMLNALHGNNRYCVHFYPVNEKLMPDFKSIDGETDVFLFVHYFGNYCDAAAAKDFCRHHEALMIEDCTHVLYPCGKFGMTGDVALFSLYECTATVDGSVICINKTNKLSETDMQYLRETVDGLPQPAVMKRYIISFIKKTTGICVGDTYLPEHYCDKTSFGLCGYRMSEPSKRILSNLSDRDFRKMKYYRQKNLKMLKDIIGEYRLPLLCVNGDGENDIPYVGVFEVTEKEKVQEITHILRAAGLPLGVWSYLPYELRMADAETVENPTACYFTIPIHQNISCSELVRKFSTAVVPKFEKKISVVPFSGDRNAWDSMMLSSCCVPITQDYCYGAAKAKCDGADCRRYTLECEGKTVGFFQCIVKKRLFLQIVRINKGPVFTTETAALKYAAFLALKRTFNLRSGCVLAIAPNEHYSSTIVKHLLLLGFRMLNYTNKYTAFVDLRQEESEIRSGLNAKWRNQLKAAEKHSQTVVTAQEDFENYMARYEAYMEEKSFSGVPIAYLRKLFELNSENLHIYCDVAEGETVAFDIVYVHGSTATYLVGWENDAGRKLYANNYLIFCAMMALKEIGVSYFDLGGLGLISAPAIAKFKLGITDKITEYAGDYLSY